MEYRYINLETKSHRVMFAPQSGHIIALDEHSRMTARQDYDFNVNDTLINPSVEQESIVNLVKKYVLSIKKLKWATYELEIDGKKAVVEFQRNGAFSTVDGKYYPAWILKSWDGKDYVCLDKQGAINKALYQFELTVLRRKTNES